MIDTNNIKKIAVIGGVALFGTIVALNSYTVVDAGTTKVQTTFGTVSSEALSEGLHFPVNPLSSFDVFDTRNNKYEVNGLNIPTQDRFNSTGNVTVLYRIDAIKAPYIKQNYGTAEEYVNKTLRQFLRSIIRDEGRKMPDSRALANSMNVTEMQTNAKNRLLEKLDGTGIVIQDLLVQDIEFDPKIKQQILATQTRIQQEEAKKSEERQAITNAKIKQQQAIGEANKKNEETDAHAYQVNEIAKAEKAAAIARAQGLAQATLLQAQAEADSIKLIAEANIKLAKSLTPKILEKQRLDNEAILYSKSVGNVPTTVIGDTDLRALGVPVATNVK